MSEEEKTLCELLQDISEALYYIGEEIRPKEVNYPRYSRLYEQVEDLKKRIGCKK